MGTVPSIMTTFLLCVAVLDGYSQQFSFEVFGGTAWSFATPLRVTERTLEATTVLELLDVYHEA